MTTFYVRLLGGWMVWTAVWWVLQYPVARWLRTLFFDPWAQTQQVYLVMALFVHGLVTLFCSWLIQRYFRRQRDDFVSLRREVMKKDQELSNYLRNQNPPSDEK